MVCGSCCKFEMCADLFMRCLVCRESTGSAGKEKNTDTIQCFLIGRERRTVSMFDDRNKGLGGSDI